LQDPHDLACIDFTPLLSSSRSRSDRSGFLLAKGSLDKMEWEADQLDYQLDEVERKLVEEVNIHRLI
jgi:hypothetical protein